MTTGVSGFSILFVGVSRTTKILLCDVMCNIYIGFSDLLLDCNVLVVIYDVVLLETRLF